MRQVKLITEVSVLHSDNTQIHADDASGRLEHRINKALAEGWSLVGTVQAALCSDGERGGLCVLQATLEAEVEPELTD
jgi:hypothetical protein